MANRRGASVGDIPRFDLSAGIRQPPLDLPAGEGRYFERAAAALDGLSATLGGLADKAAAREGAAEGAAAGASAGLPGEGKGMLARRNDGTIRGEAFDAAAMETYGARFDAGLRADVATAYDIGKDDPAAFETALAGVRQKYEKDVGGDPALLTAFTARFEQQAFAYRRDVTERMQRRVLEERQVARDEQYAAMRQDIERRAMLGGAAGDGALAEDVARFAAQLQADVESGTLTPKQAYAYRKGLTETVTLARVRGTAARMGPEAAIAFADELERSWAAGDPALADLDFDAVGRAAGEIRGRAGRESARRASGTRAQSAALSAALKDDLASIEATGQPLALNGAPLDMEMLAGALGADKAEAHRQARAAAAATYAATADLAFLTAEEIAARSAALEPEPGAEGFKARAEIKAAFEKKAKSVLDLRRADPAAAVADLVEDGLGPQESVAARLAAQEAVGIPEAAREPLTRREAEDYVRRVTAAAPDQRVEAMKSLLAEVESGYGGATPEVMAQILRTSGVDAETARYGYRLLNKLNLGGRVTGGDVRDGRVTGETSAAARAVDPAARDPMWSKGTTTTDATGESWSPEGAAAEGVPGQIRQPPPEALQMLADNPGLAPAFDEMFGPGTANYYLGRAAGRAGKP